MVPLSLRYSIFSPVYSVIFEVMFENLNFYSGKISTKYSSRHRRGKSETLRVQYINTKEVRFGFKFSSFRFDFCDIGI